MNLKDTFNIIKRNFSWLIAGEIMIRLMMLVLTILLAKEYGPENFGIYALALNTGNLAEILFNMGLPTVFMQKVAGEKNEQVIEDELAVFLPLRICLSILSFAAFIGFISLLHKPLDTYLSLLIAGLYFSLFSIDTFLWSCFDSRQKMHYTALAKLITYIFIFGFGFYFMIEHQPIHIIISVYLLGTIASLVFTTIVIHKKFTKIRFTFSKTRWLDIVSQGWPVAMSGAFVFVYNYLDTILISISKGEEAVGLYGISYKIIGTIFILSTLINQAYLPSLITADKNDKEKLSTLFNRSLDSALFWSIPISIGGFIISRRLIDFVFGPAYAAGIPAFRILIWNCLIFFISSAMTNLLFAVKRQKTVMKIFFIGAFVNTVANIFIIPKFGIEGAAFTTLLAEIAVLIGNYIKVKPYIKINFIKSFFKPLIASLAMTIGLLTTRNESIILTVLFGALIYFGVHWLLGDNLKIMLLKNNPDFNSQDIP